jgi:hypothetical protein
MSLEDTIRSLADDTLHITKKISNYDLFIKNTLKNKINIEKYIHNIFTLIRNDIRLKDTNIVISCIEILSFLLSLYSNESYIIEFIHNIDLIITDILLCIIDILKQNRYHSESSDNKNDAIITTLFMLSEQNTPNIFQIYVLELIDILCDNYLIMDFSDKSNECQIILLYSIRALHRLIVQFPILCENIKFIPTIVIHALQHDNQRIKETALALFDEAFHTIKLANCIQNMISCETKQLMESLRYISSITHSCHLLSFFQKK